MTTLNVGCGGRAADKASDLGDVRIDIKYFNTVTTLADAHQLPFKDASFDRILCYQVLEHLVSPFFALKEMSRVLKVEGEIEITIPNVWFWHKILRWLAGEGEPYDLPDHKQGWDVYEFQRLVRQTNLEIANVTFLNWYPREKTYEIERYLPDCLSGTHVAIRLRKKN